MKNQEHDEVLLNAVKPYQLFTRIVQMICFIALLSAIVVSIWYNLGIGLRIAITAFLIHSFMNGALAWITVRLRNEMYGYSIDTAIKHSNKRN